MLSRHTVMMSCANEECVKLRAPCCVVMASTCNYFICLQCFIVSKSIYVLTFVI